MKATDILKDEHTLILVMLRVIDAACARMESGEHVEHGDIADMIDFIRNFADRCHHTKEESLLFPAMEKAGIERDHGPIGVMLAEHTAGRNFAKGMDRALQLLKEGDETATEMFIADGQGYVSLLDGHIMKENTVLFTLADERLSPEQQKELAGGFDRVEREEIGAGVHEKYHELLHRLRDRYAPDAA